MFSQTILKRINDSGTLYLHSLCFHIPLADDQMVEYLQTMIQNEQLLLQFTIKRILAVIYLHWNQLLYKSNKQETWHLRHFRCTFS